MKHRALFTAAICALCFCLPVFASPSPARAVAAAEVWTTYGSEKILQNETYGAEVKTDGLTVSMAQNEYEAGQIVITAASAISSVDVTVSDLTGAGGTFPKENIEVFWEKYLNVTRVATVLYPTGVYPDGLVPFANLKAAGENSVEAGNNQGLYVRFNTKGFEKSGTFTGSIAIKLDGAEQAVPVSLDVMDFAIGDKVNTSSSFMIYADGLTQGELDSTDEMYKKYYDFLLDYRVNAMNLPSSMDVEDLVASVREYYDNPAVSCYNINYVGWNGNVWYDRLENAIRALIEASVEDRKNYLDKAYVYNLYIDEYSGNAVKLQKARNWLTEFRRIRDNCVKYFDDRYGAEYIDSVEGLRGTALNITDLAVTGLVSGLSELTNCICPGYSVFQTEADRERLHDYFSDEYDRLWWYGCIGPNPPFPSYHIDDTALSARILSWMQYEYEIDGNLYFSTSMYYGDAGEHLAYPVDEWSLANRNLGGGNVNGDGWVTYPGEKYGIDGPLPSIRLEAIRDGLEEYEYFTYLDELLAKLGPKYGMPDIDSRSILASEFASVHTNMYTITDSAQFDLIRSQVFDVISAAKDGDMLAIRRAADYDKIELDVYLPSDAAIGDHDPSVAFAASENTTDGKKFPVTVTRTDGEETRLAFSYTSGGATYTVDRYLDDAVTTVLTFDGDDKLSYASMDSGITENKKEIVGGRLRMELHSAEGNSDYRPYLALPTAFIETLPKDASEIIVEFFNDNAAEITVEVGSRTRTNTGIVSESLAATCTVPANCTFVLTISIDNIDTLAGFRLYIPRSDDAEIVGIGRIGIKR